MSVGDVPINPFTNDDYVRWQNAERNLERLIEFLDKAESCGIDCKDYRAEAAKLREQFARLRQTFFPQGIIP